MLPDPSCPAGRTAARRPSGSRWIARLFVAGGATGSVWVYDLRTRALVRRFDTGSGGFINDVAIAPNGEAYVTDSQRPNLYRITRADVGAGTGDTVALPVFTTYPAVGTGFRANGIVSVNADTLVYVNSSAGKLFRVDLADGNATTEVDLGVATVANGNGSFFEVARSTSCATCRA